MEYVNVNLKIPVEEIEYYLEYISDETCILNIPFARRAINSIVTAYREKQKNEKILRCK